MDAVDRTLKLWRTHPFKWGGSVPHVPGSGDCMLSIAEHSAGLPGGVDVTGRYRGTYDDEAGALAWIERDGGAWAIFASFGRPECVQGPGRGDIAVINLGGDPVGALCTGGAMALRLERGVIEVRTKFLTVEKAWQCPR